MECIWQEDEDGVFDTGCDGKFFFDSGGIAENKFHFCPYCGKKILEAKTRREDED